MNPIHRLRLWIQDGKNYWIVILPLILTIALFFRLRVHPGGLDDFRVIGIFIEIGGLFTVVWSLSRESKKYEYDGYFHSFILWLRGLRYVFFPRKPTPITANCSESVSFAESANLTLAISYKTIEEKVNYLMQKVVDMDKVIYDNKKRIEQVNKDLLIEINKSNATLQQELIKIKDELKEKATVDYYLLVSGALLTIIGMIMTNLPDSYFFKFFAFTPK